MSETHDKRMQAIQDWWNATTHIIDSHIEGSQIQHEEEVREKDGVINDLVEALENNDYFDRKRRKKEVKHQ